MAARKSALLIEVPPQEANHVSAGEQENTAKGRLSLIEGRADRVDPYALAMDQALGLEMRPFSTASRWNSHAIEFACSLAPVVCEMFSLAVKACVELQLNWLSWIPGWRLGTEAQLEAGADGKTVMESYEEQRIRLAESMDLALGQEPAQLGPALLRYAEIVAAATLAAAAAESRAMDSDEGHERAMAAAAGF